jgi:hypothetical protein
LFQDVLSQFDTQPDGFSLQRVQDELVGQMAELLEADYDTLALEINDSENRQRALTSEPSPTPRHCPLSYLRPHGRYRHLRWQQLHSGPMHRLTHGRDVFYKDRHDSRGWRRRGGRHRASTGRQRHERLQGHIVSPAPTTERLQSLQRLVADQLGDKLPDFEANALRAIPVQVGGLYPISDVWYIEPGLDVPDRLRVHIAQFAREIGEEAAVGGHIEAIASAASASSAWLRPWAQAKALDCFRSCRADPARCAKRSAGTRNRV